MKKYFVYFKHEEEEICCLLIQRYLLQYQKKCCKEHGLTLKQMILQLISLQENISKLLQQQYWITVNHIIDDIMETEQISITENDIRQFYEYEKKIKTMHLRRMSNFKALCRALMSKMEKQRIQTFSFMEDMDVNLKDKMYHLINYRKILERISSDKIKASFNEIQKMEIKLSVLIDTLRQESESQKIDKCMEKIKALLDSIKKKAAENFKVQGDIISNYDPFLKKNAPELKAAISKFLQDHPKRSLKYYETPPEAFTHFGIEGEKIIIPALQYSCTVFCKLLQDLTQRLWTLMAQLKQSIEEEYVENGKKWTQEQTSFINIAQKTFTIFHEKRYDRIEKNIKQIRLNELFCHKEQLSSNQKMMANSKKEINTKQEGVSLLIKEKSDQMKSVIENEMSNMKHIQNKTAISAFHRKLQNLEKSSSDKLETSLSNIKEEMKHLTHSIQGKNIKRLKFIRFFSEGGDYSAAEVSSYIKETENAKKVLQDLEKTTFKNLEQAASLISKERKQASSMIDNKLQTVDECLALVSETRKIFRHLKFSIINEIEKFKSKESNIKQAYQQLDEYTSNFYLDGEKTTTQGPNKHHDVKKVLRELWFNLLTSFCPLVEHKIIRTHDAEISGENYSEQDLGYGNSPVFPGYNAVFQAAVESIKSLAHEFYSHKQEKILANYSDLIYSKYDDFVEETNYNVHCYKEEFEKFSQESIKNIYSMITNALVMAKKHGTMLIKMFHDEQVTMLRDQRLLYLKEWSAKGKENVTALVSLEARLLALHGSLVNRQLLQDLNKTATAEVQKCLMSMGVIERKFKNTMEKMLNFYRSSISDFSLSVGKLIDVIFRNFEELADDLIEESPWKTNILSSDNMLNPPRVGDILKIPKLILRMPEKTYRTEIPDEKNSTSGSGQITPSEDETSQPSDESTSTGLGSTTISSQGNGDLEEDLSKDLTQHDGEGTHTSMVTAINTDEIKMLQLENFTMIVEEFIAEASNHLESYRASSKIWQKNWDKSRSMLELANKVPYV
ncbi:uncharacterized protein LOC124160548 isoform X2 [Ischnura elegans]|uniref:uncharacterized protein LOC124160548 isoform X2 n=1 Tax=Ischnura elegans TaxID=197161 RepID=UPI001ED88743|nr:uncharacterized protein LOC124160548 isoform X2 [Ischnura elegans]